MTIVYQHNDNIFNKINYICVIYIIISAIHNSRANKWCTNCHTDHILDQNKSIWSTINGNITFVFMVVNYYQLMTKICEMDQLYQMVNKTHNFDTFTIIINVLDIIAHDIETLIFFSI